MLESVMPITASLTRFLKVGVFTNLTNVKSIKNNKIQNRLTLSIYFSTAPLGVMSLDIITQDKATSSPLRMLQQ